MSYLTKKKERKLLIKTRRLRNEKSVQVFPIFCALVWITILLHGCGGNIPTAPSLTAEEKALLRRYGLVEFGLSF